MRTKNTFSISFWADLKNTKNDKALIYARVTVNSKRVNISLKRKVYINDWDSKKSKAKGTSPHARQTNLSITVKPLCVSLCATTLRHDGYRDCVKPRNSDHPQSRKPAIPKTRPTSYVLKSYVNNCKSSVTHQFLE